MEDLEATMNKHNIHPKISSTLSSGHVLFSFSYSFNVSSSSNEWHINSRSSYPMAKDKTIFSTQMNVTPNIFFFW